MKQEDIQEKLVALKLERRPVRSTRPWRAIGIVAVFAAGYGLAWWQTANKRPPETNGSTHAENPTTSAEMAPVARVPYAEVSFKGFIKARQKVSVSSSISGRLKQMTVKEGDRVQKGQLVALLDDRDALAQMEMARAQVGQAVARVKEMEAQHAKARLDSSRTHELARQGMVSEASVNDADYKVESALAQLSTARATVEVQERALKLAQVTLDNTVIRSPMDGLVISTSAGPGEIVAPLSAVGSSTRSGICTVADMSSVEVELEVPERLIARVAIGQRTIVSLDAYPDLRLAARVSSVGSSASRGGGTVPVRVLISEKDDRLLPDMAATVTWVNQ